MSRPIPWREERKNPGEETFLFIILLWLLHFEYEEDITEEFWHVISHKAGEN